MAEETTNSRLETFCDGVFAIALTLLILDIKIPLPENIHTAEDLWHALRQLLPHISAFLLSFALIVISWVNHHAVMKLINQSTPPFIYANVFLLLSIVIIPFPTALFSEFGFTPASSPAVVLYCFAMLLTNIGWILIIRTATSPVLLARSQAGKVILETVSKQARAAFFIYLACTILAFWFPTPVFIVITLTWVGWLLFGIYYKEKE